jgi:hypothetical protein
MGLYAHNGLETAGSGWDSVPTIRENHVVTTATRPDPEAEWWTRKDVAAYLGIAVAAVSSYRRRGQMPEPDKTIGTRTHLWKPTRIIEWHGSRDRVGVGGRPRGSQSSPATIPTPEPDDASRWITHGRRSLYES